MPLQAGRDDADPAAQTLFIHWRVAAERLGGIATATIAAGGAGRAPRSVARSHRRRLIHIYFEVRALGPSPPPARLARSKRHCSEHRWNCRSSWAPDQNREEKHRWESGLS